MSWQKLFAYVFIGAVAGGIGYGIYERSELMTAIVGVFTVSWLLYRFTGKKMAWDTISELKNPFMMAIIAALAGITYYAAKGNFFPESLGFGLGVAMIGAAVSMLLYKYWNIGG